MDRSKVNILVVEDDKVIREMYTRYLKDAGFSVVAAKSGEEAVNYVEQNTPSIIFLDLLMSSMKGDRVIEMIEKVQGMQVVPKVIISNADIKEEDKKKWEKYTIVDYAVKANMKLQDLVTLTEKYAVVVT